MSESHAYHVKLTHPCEPLTGLPGAPQSIRLWPADLEDRKALGLALRTAGVLPKGGSVLVFGRLNGPASPIVVRPCIPGARADWAIELTRADLWTVIGRGRAGWHAARPGCSSSGGTLEPVTYQRQQYVGYDLKPVGEPVTRAGYLADAAEGCHVYDASGADVGAFTSFVLCGPILAEHLGDEVCEPFGQSGVESARGMLGPGGLEDGFAALASVAIAQHEAGRKYGSLDSVGWGIYRRLLAEVGGVRFGEVRNGAVVWEEPS